MRRIGSNIRKKNSEGRSNRLTKNIIKYTMDEKPRNEYPRKIVSPPMASECCTDENRATIGSMREIEGFKFCYRICKECGHAVKYFYPAVESTSQAVRDYRSWKRYLTQ
ncbi:MAG: hypothetical protein VCB78_09845 [Myxococcota bacterium]